MTNCDGLVCQGPNHTYHHLSDWSLIQIPKPMLKICYKELIQGTNFSAWVPKEAEPETKDYMQDIGMRDGRVKQGRQEN